MLHSFGAAYTTVAELISIDHRKDDIIDKLVNIICQQYGVEALPDDLYKEISEVARKSEQIREDI